MELILSCSPGLENLLRDEIMRLCPGLAPSTQHGSVACEANEDQLAKIYLGSFLASRLHLVLRKFSARNEAMLYDQVRRVAWADILSIESTFLVQTRGRSKDFDLNFAALKIKDAICDEIRKHKEGLRPNVSREDPDFRVTAFFDEGRCDLLLDLSLDVLHRRGYRSDAGDAPLRENKAAALSDLLDTKIASKKFEAVSNPFCGSGTLLLEWALKKLGAPRCLELNPRDPIFRLYPQLKKSLNISQQEAWQGFREALSKKVLPPLLASDISSKQIEAAQNNAHRLGLEKHIQFRQSAADQFEEKNQLILANPPYGERLGDEEQSIELLKTWGRHVKHKQSPCTLGITLSRTGLAKHLGFKPDLRLPVENGSIPLELIVCEIYEGRSASSLGSSKRG